jgi:hypothetical protein
MISKLLQTPEIIEIKGSTIRVRHPDLSGNAKTFLTAPHTAAGTTLTVADNTNFDYTSSKGDYLVFGEVGDSKAEEATVNNTVTRGTSLTIANSTKFSHEINTPITVTRERGIKIYGAATDGGTGTLIASVDAITSPIADAVMIQWEKAYTEYTLISTDTTYAYYFVKFTDGTTDSSASDYVLAAGLAYNTVEEVVYGALKKCNAKIDADPDGLITREWLLEVANDFQDEVTNHQMTTPEGNKLAKDWSFELFEEINTLTITENENKYALSGLTADLKYDSSKEAILNIRLGQKILDYYDIDEYDEGMEDNIRGITTVATAVGDTTMTLSDTYEFAENGTVYIGGDAVTYTTNTESTGVLSGIPSSGTGSITAINAVGTTVWQGISPGDPSKYTIFGGYILLDIPPSDEWVGYKLKVRGLKKLPRLTSFSDAFGVPLTHLAKIYIASQIEYRKGNDQQGQRLENEFRIKLNDAALRDRVQSLQQTEYYLFGEEDS